MTLARMVWPLSLCFIAACKGGEAALPAAPAFDPGPVPPSLAEGATRFEEMCAPCHGEYGTGQSIGPPLIDTLYLLRRFGDAEFQRAVATGVKQKHWNFGDMPKITRATASNVSQIAAYVHWVQERAGVR
jgi:Cytochrome C oxidase, cbb3-type, subunit III